MWAGHGLKTNDPFVLSFQLGGSFGPAISHVQEHETVKQVGLSSP